jgi:cyclopropane fatty-acyl-phospholipid synthase-like methyltransferase
MSIWKPLRTLFIKTTNFTLGYQDNHNKLISFYSSWAKIYDITIRMDPAYTKQLKKMISLVVSPLNSVLDIGCGTGIGTIYSAKIAKSVTGIDISADMLSKLKQKIRKKKITNVKLILGKYPDRLANTYDVVISSFAIVHLSPEKRKNIYRSIYSNLRGNGKIGLFSARGEIAPAFETKDEISKNLKDNGFQNIEIRDVSDIYRITIAEK